MSLIEKIIARAQANRQRIVLPEAEEERTLIAADKALADKLARNTAINTIDEIADEIAELINSQKGV